MLVVENKKVTMQSVADKADVSIATVSRVFAGKRGAEPAVRKRVIEVAEELGYRKLRRQREPVIVDNDLGKSNTSPSGKIVFLACDLQLADAGVEGSRYHAMIACVHNYARKLGYNIILASEDSKSKPIMPEVIREKEVGGVIVANAFDSDFMAQLVCAIPTVMVNCCVDWPTVSSVVINYRAMLFKGVDYLRKLGHRRISLFVPHIPSEQLRRPEYFRIRETNESYKDALEHFDLDTDPELLLKEKFGMNEHPRAIANAMDRICSMKTRPTAIITSSFYAIFFWHEAIKRGMDVPGDLSILATDDGVLNGLPISAFRSNMEIQPAIDLLKRHIEEKDYHNQSIQVDPEMIERDSTGPVTIERGGL